MNCKPGDLAVVTHVNHASLSINVGQIVEVLHATFPDPEFGHVWLVKMLGIGATARHGICVSPVGICPDVALRPISGVPVDQEQHAEVLA